MRPTNSLTAAATTLALTALLALSTAACQGPTEDEGPPAAGETADAPAEAAPAETGAAAETVAEEIHEVAIPDSLPHSMKGYSLYGWTRDGGEYFTLVTGTNRLKTFTELDDPEPLIEDGWVRIRVNGSDEAADLLSRVPADEFVMVKGIGHVSVFQDDIPDDVGAPDAAVLERLRGTR